MFLRPMGRDGLACGDQSSTHKDRQINDRLEGLLSLRRMMGHFCCPEIKQFQDHELFFRVLCSVFLEFDAPRKLSARRVFFKALSKLRQLVGTFWVLSELHLSRGDHRSLS